MIPFTILALTMLSTPAIAQVQPGPSWPMYDGGWMWWMPFHVLLFLLLVAAVVVGVVFLIRFLWHPGSHPFGPGGRSTALELLDHRYARGEIDRDEYVQRKRDLLEHR